ncbi:MAG: class I SAM-dependent methyltransferase [Chloroflexota bacterium]
MLTNILHSIAAQPIIYNTLQKMLGAGQSQRRVALLLADLPAGSVVVDVGGGTGIYRPTVPAACQYYCVDLDALKVAGFQQRFPSDHVLRGDGLALPFRGGSVDSVLCIAVCHHLSNEQLPRFLTECRRLLKPGGKLVLLDPVWNPRQLTGRLLWAYDRGDFPRSPETLLTILARQGRVVTQDIYAIWHTYLLCVVVMD